MKQEKEIVIWFRKNYAFVIFTPIVTAYILSIIGLVNFWSFRDYSEEFWKFDTCLAYLFFNTIALMPPLFILTIRRIWNGKWRPYPEGWKPR